jgi:hypothetical protein
MLGCSLLDCSLLDCDEDWNKVSFPETVSSPEDHYYSRGTTGVIAAGMLVLRELRFCIRGRVRAVQGRDSGRDLGVPGKGRDVGCFGGIVHWQGSWDIGTEYPEPDAIDLATPFKMFRWKIRIRQSIHLWRAAR